MCGWKIFLINVDCFDIFIFCNWLILFCCFDLIEVDGIFFMKFFKIVFLFILVIDMCIYGINFFERNIVCWRDKIIFVCLFFFGGLKFFWGGLCVFLFGVVCYGLIYFLFFFVCCMSNCLVLRLDYLVVIFVLILFL